MHDQNHFIFVISFHLCPGLPLRLSECNLVCITYL